MALGIPFPDQYLSYHKLACDNFAHSHLKYLFQEHPCVKKTVLIHQRLLLTISRRTFLRFKKVIA